RRTQPKQEISSSASSLSLSFQCHQVSSHVVDVVIRPFRKHINVVLQRVVDNYALHICAAIVSEVIVIGIRDRDGEIIQMVELAFNCLAVRERHRGGDGGLRIFFGSGSKAPASSCTPGDNRALK